MKHLYLLLCLYGFTAVSQNDTIWINNNELSIQQKATHYFIFEKVEARNLYKVSKHTKDNLPVFKGTSFNKDYKNLIFTDKLYHYNEKGILLNVGMITNNKYNGQMISYSEKGEELLSEFRDNELYNGTYIFEDDNRIKISHVENGQYIKQTIYVNDSEKIVLTFDNNIVTSIKYFINEKLISSGEYKNNAPFNGAFYDLNKDFKRIYASYLYKEALLLEKKNFYKNGTIREHTVLENETYRSTFYNQQSEEMGTITYKLDEDNLPLYLDGTQYHFSNTTTEEVKTGFTYAQGKVTTIHYYEDNEINQIVHFRDETLDKIDYYKKNQLFSSVNFDTESNPINGTVVEDFEDVTYKDKKIIKVEEYYKDKQLFCTYDNSTYKYTYYDKEGVIIEEHQTMAEKTTLDKKIANGTICILDENKEYIKTEEIYKNALLEKKFEFSYIDNKRILLNEFLFKAGELIRKRQYFPSAKIQSFETFSGDNLLAGIYYDENGNQIGKYDALKKNGVYIKYFPHSTDINIKAKWLNKMLLEYHEFEYDLYGKKLHQKIEMKLNSNARFYFNNEVVAEAELENGKIKNGKIFHNQDSRYYIYNNYEDYAKEGEELFYSKTTNELVYRNFYHKGILQFRELYKNNNLFLSIPVINGIFSGYATMYDKNGQVKNKIDFKDNMIYNGTIEYIENDLFVKEIYKNGEQKLLEITNSNGVKLLRRTPSDYNLQKYEMKHPNGQMYYTFTSYGNIFHGKLLQYNSLGVVEQQQRFEYGIPRKGNIKTLFSFPTDEDKYVSIYSTHTFNKDQVTVENYSQNQLFISKHKFNLKVTNDKKSYAKIIARTYSLYPLIYKYIDTYEPLILKKPINTELILNF